MPGLPTWACHTRDLTAILDSWSPPPQVLRDQLLQGVLALTLPPPAEDPSGHILQEVCAARGCQGLLSGQAQHPGLCLRRPSRPRCVCFGGGWLQEIRNFQRLNKQSSVFLNLSYLRQTEVGGRGLLLFPFQPKWGELGPQPFGEHCSWICGSPGFDLFERRPPGPSTGKYQLP